MNDIQILLAVVTALTFVLAFVLCYVQYLTMKIQDRREDRL